MSYVCPSDVNKGQRNLLSVSMYNTANDFRVLSKMCEYLCEEEGFLACLLDILCTAIQARKVLIMLYSRFSSCVRE